jgi:hypothetical protein
VALLLVQTWARTPLLTALGGLVFLLSLWPFYFPVRYHLGEAGVEVDYGLWRRRCPWQRFRAFIPLPDGIILTPFLHPTRLERFRALWLPCPENVLAVRQELPAHLTCRDQEEVDS